jgi:hypothetical protein
MLSEEKQTWEKTCPICSLVLRYPTFDLEKHMISNHSVEAILHELLRLWRIVNGK